MAWTTFDDNLSAQDQLAEWRNSHLTASTPLAQSLITSPQLRRHLAASSANNLASHPHGPFPLLDFSSKSVLISEVSKSKERDKSMPKLTNSSSPTSLIPLLQLAHRSSSDQVPSTASKVTSFTMNVEDTIPSCKQLDTSNECLAEFVSDGMGGVKKLVEKLQDAETNKLVEFGSKFQRERIRSSGTMVVKDGKLGNIGELEHGQTVTIREPETSIVEDQDVSGRVGGSTKSCGVSMVNDSKESTTDKVETGESDMNHEQDACVAKAKHLAGTILTDALSEINGPSEAETNGIHVGEDEQVNVKLAAQVNDNAKNHVSSPTHIISSVVCAHVQGLCCREEDLAFFNSEINDVKPVCDVVQSEFQNVNRCASSGETNDSKHVGKSVLPRGDVSVAFSQVDSDLEPHPQENDDINDCSYENDTELYSVHNLVDNNPLDLSCRRDCAASDRDKIVNSECPNENTPGDIPSTENKETLQPTPGCSH